MRQTLTTVQTRRVFMGNVSMRLAGTGARARFHGQELIVRRNSIRVIPCRVDMDSVSLRATTEILHVAALLVLLVCIIESDFFRAIPFN